jgi:hypothetical protein
MSKQIGKLWVTAGMVASAAVLLFGAACDQETTAEKQQTLCTEVSQLNVALKSLEDLGPTATVDQFKDAGKEVREQGEDVRKAFGSLEESKAEDLDQAVTDLKISIDDVSSDTTIA